MNIRRIAVLRLENGKCPFEEWMRQLKGPKLMQAVDARLTRIRDGNFGDHKSVGQGVFELRIPKGPGLRVYYALDHKEVILLLGGGDKSFQKRDIEYVKELWEEYKHES